MLNNLATPGTALALALTFVLTAGTAGVVRTRHEPDKCAGLCIVLLVLTLTTAASVVAFQPLQPGDLVEKREQR